MEWGGLVEGIHRGHDLIVGAFVNGPGMGIEGAFDFDKTFSVRLGALGVLAAEIKDAPVVRKSDPTDEFTEIGVEDGIILEEKEGGGFLLLGLADRETDGEGEGVAAFAPVSAWVAAKAGIDGREALSSHPDLGEMPFQLGAPIFAPSEVDVVAERKGFFEIHTGFLINFP